MKFLYFALLKKRGPWTIGHLGKTRFRDIFENPENGFLDLSPLPDPKNGKMEPDSRLRRPDPLGGWGYPPSPPGGGGVPPPPEGGLSQKSFFDQWSVAMAVGRGEGPETRFWGKVKMSRKRVFPKFPIVQ